MRDRRVIHPGLLEALEVADKDALKEQRIVNLNDYLLLLWQKDSIYDSVERFDHPLKFGKFDPVSRGAKYNGMSIDQIDSSTRLLTTHRGLPDRRWSLHIKLETHRTPLLFVPPDEFDRDHTYHYEYPKGYIAYAHNYSGMWSRRPVAELMNECHIISAGLLRDTLEHQIRLLVNWVEEK